MTVFRPLHGVLWAVLALILCASPSLAQTQPEAFIGARILPISADEIEDGVLVVQDGRILAVGPAATVRIPEDALVHDVAGRLIMPGLVCTHSHVGGPWAADGSHPIQPECRVLDAINVRDAGIQKAQAGGITTANVMPGSSQLISGQTLYLKLRDGEIIDDLLILDEEGDPMGGLKMANGTNSQKAAPFPGTRGKSAALVRQAYLDAQEYGRKLEAAGDDPEKAPPRDLGKEVLLEVLRGERVVHYHTHRHDDILTVLRLREEFEFRLVLQHISDGWKVSEQIAAAGVPCSIILLDAPGGKEEAVGLEWSTARILEEEGVPVAFHTDDPINDSRYFLRSAGLARRGGMSRQGALEGVTLVAARMLDLGDRIGSLEVGKDADFIVLSGDPLSVYTRIQQTWIEGEKVFDLADDQDRLWAEGGDGASRPQAFTWCCHEGGE